MGYAGIYPVPVHPAEYHQVLQIKGFPENDTLINVNVCWPILLDQPRHRHNDTLECDDTEQTDVSLSHPNSTWSYGFSQSQPHLGTSSESFGRHNSSIPRFFLSFFEVSMTSSLAFFGCLLRGITFRQPCRCKTK